LMYTVAALPGYRSATGKRMTCLLLPVGREYNRAYQLI
jgi:hypothetical protein